MRGVLVLVYVGAFFISVKCEDSPGWEIDVLIQQIDQLESSDVTIYRELEESKQLTLTLHTQLQEEVTSKNVTLMELQQKVLELTEAAIKSEEKHQIQNEKYVLEILQVKTNQNALEQQLEQSRQQIATLKDQLLQTQNAQLEQLQNQMVEQNKAQVTLGAERTVLAGLNWNKGELYVGRIRHKGDYFVVKASVKDEKCYLAYGGEELDFNQCEVLTGSHFSWMKSSDGILPGNAFPCGRKANGEPQFIGRIEHGPFEPQSVSPGTIDCSDRSLSIPFHTTERKFNGSEYEYEVLVIN